MYAVSWAGRGGWARVHELILTLPTYLALTAQLRGLLVSQVKPVQSAF